MHVVPTRSELDKICATGNRVFGCTAFVGEKLTYACERGTETAWQLRAAAQFVPYIYMLTRNMDGIAHEKMHIEDIRRSLQRYLTDLESRTFDSEERCTTSGELEASLFNRHMDEWKVQSNLDRHPELRRAAK